MMSETTSDDLRIRQKEARRAAEERELFEATLRDCPIRPLTLPRMFPGIERQAIEIEVIDPETKHPNHVDMLYVCAIARHVRARRVFEFGTYLGRTTLHLALGADVETVFTLDLDPAGTYPALELGRAVRAVHERGLQGHFFQHHPRRDRITQLHGDSRTFDYAPYRASIDFVFVDGGHSYEMIANDTEKAFTMLRPGGVVVWHDFAPKGRDVVLFAREFSRTRPLFWVVDTSLLVYVDGVDPLTYDAPLPVYDRSLIKPLV
jgi:predicted O-methyltransferase YrrM